MRRSEIIACFLCLTLLASSICAQDSQPHDSDHLKKKIEEVESAAPKSGTASVNLTYKRILLRRYDQYIFSLQQDIEDLRKIRTTLDENESDGIKEIDADIERLTKEHVVAAEKARLLCAEAQVGVVTQPTHHPISQREEAQLPCLCLPRAEKKEKEEKGECKTEATAGADKKDNEPVGVFWCGKAGADKLSVKELAERVAPILWFSPDEPLLKEGKPIPEKLPGDVNPVEPVVYYRISHLVLNRSAPLSYEPDLVGGLDLKNIKKLTLQYYFYYSKDEGFKPHTHDLESARFDVHFTLRDEEGKEIPNPSEKDAVSNSNYYVTADVELKKLRKSKQFLL